MTSFSRSLLLASCLSALALVYACGDDSEAADSDHDAEHDHDAGGEHNHDDPVADVDLDAATPCSAEYPSFTAGMSKPAGALTVKLMSISPEPPRQKVKNDWTVQVVDASGAPATGITLANADSYMPVHRHHGKTLPYTNTTSEPGGAQITKIDFIMRGPWQVLFDVLQNGTKVGTATFQICVE